ncbi:SCO family protein [Mariniluteicoccus endophyticus]
MRRLVVALVAAATLLTACGAQSSSGGVVVPRSDARADEPGLRGGVLPQPFDVPDVTLVDTAGQRYNLRTSPSRPVTLVFFGYTHCPDVCIAQLSDVASALTKVPDPERADIQVVFVSTDPARDTPTVVRDYLARFDPSFLGLTGEPADIRRAAEGLGVSIEHATPLPGGGYEVGHGAQVIGVGRGARAFVVWTPGTSINDLAHDFTLFARQQR